MKAKRISLGAAGALFALLFVLLILAACGGDGDDADPTATEPAAEDPTATEPADAQPTDEPEPTEPAEPDPTEPAEPDPTEPAAAETTIDVTLTDFVLEPSDDSAPAGTITFNVSSEGAIFHSFTVIATDLAADALPTDDATFSVDEAQLDVVASTDELDPGQQEELIVDLDGGSYVLICNIPTHYDLGMTVAFTVE